MGLEEGQSWKAGDMAEGDPLGGMHAAGWEKEGRGDRGEGALWLHEKGHTEMLKIFLTSIIS